MAQNHNEAFLQANANRKFIAQEMADVIRELLRSAASDRDTGMKAAEKMDFVAQLLQRCDEKLGWWHLFSDGLEVLRDIIKEKDGGDNDLAVARDGLKLLAEMSANDPAAKARVARRRNEFHSAIRFIAA